MNDEKLHNVKIPHGTLRRLTRYYEYLKGFLKGDDTKYNGCDAGVRCHDTCISSTKIANEMHLNPVLVRKDLAFASSISGKPRIGFEALALFHDIENVLGYNNISDSILVGAGSLGRALLSYEGFVGYGLNIAAAFDINPLIVGTQINDIKVFDIDELQHIVRRLNIRIGIITTPKQVAQEVCDLMLGSGVQAILNFAPTHLNVPKNIILKDENLAASLALLSRKLDSKNDNK